MRLWESPIFQEIATPVCTLARNDRFLEVTMATVVITGGSRGIGAGVVGQMLALEK